MQPISRQIKKRKSQTLTLAYNTYFTKNNIITLCVCGGAPQPIHIDDGALRCDYIYK